MIKAEIVAHSVNPQGDELISVLATFPRIILAEVNTHRMLGKNTSSSRAIPFIKMIEAIDNNPFIPIAWQKEHSGMQGTEYFTEETEIKERVDKWLMGCNYAINSATSLNDDKVTKQLCNRLLEPFMWTTMLITGSREGWDNFYNLRCPNYQYELASETYNFKSWKELVNLIESTSDNKDYIDTWKNESVLGRLQHNKGQAEIHMMALAEVIYDAVNESTPRKLAPGQWHIPFYDQITDLLLDELAEDEAAFIPDEKIAKISVAMAAHTSYTIVSGDVVKSSEKWLELHDRLLSQNPPHSSPMEHCARVMFNNEYNNNVKGDTSKPSNSIYGWCRNYKGFIQYRDMIEKL